VVVDDNPSVKMRIAWIAPYPAQLLEPALRVSRKVGIYHPCSWLVTLSRALCEHDCIELHLLTDSHLVPHAQAVKVGKISFHVVKSGIPFTNRMFPPSLPLDALTGFRYKIRQFTRELREIEPDIVHAHGTENAYALAGAVSGYPCVISMQGIISEMAKISPSVRLSFIRRTERTAVLANHHFVCRTDYDSNFVRSVNPHAQIHFIHEAMNPLFFQNDWRVDNIPTVLYVGTLRPRKGVELLLQVLAEIKKLFPRVCLRLIGAGGDAYVHHLKCLTDQLNVVRNVEFLGFLPPDQVAKWHVQSQIFVLPSENENSPNALAEAMVSGLPVIATAVGGIPSMVKDGTTGLLVAPNNPEALAEKIVWLLKNPEERKRLGDSARTVARERHLPEKVATETVAAYKEILKLQGEEQ
jgi:glycosyltransferase involved in cell wall biosynthesis